MTRMKTVNSIRWIVIGISCLIWGNTKQAFSAELPEPSIHHLTIQSDLDIPRGSAKVMIEVNLAETEAAIAWENVSLSLQLIAPDHTPSAQTSITWFEPQSGSRVGHALLPLSSPRTWTAETPVLYQLSGDLRMNGNSIQKIEIPFGIRELQIQRGILTIDQTTVHLRGVNYRQEVTGDQESRWQSDLALMQEMNINTIRLTSGPPDPRFLQLCDELGFYVLDEFPLNLSEEEPDSAWQDWILRDINHPCVIAWSLGGMSAGNDPLERISGWIKKQDPSRPLLVPGLGDELLPGVADILAPRNPTRTELQNALRTDHPVIVMENAPVIDFALEGLEDFQQFVRVNQNLAGGMIQQFAASPRDGTEAVVDGIVDSSRNRTPAFFQVRQAYSPVWIEETEQRIQPGKQSVELTLFNDYDFTDLRELSCQWSLLCDGKSVQQQSSLIHLEPGKSMQIAALLDIPETLEDHDYSLRYEFTTSAGRMISQQDVRLRSSNWAKGFVSRLRDLTWDKDWKVTGDPYRLEVDHRDYAFLIQLVTAEWFMRTQERNVRLITGGPAIHLNRQPTLADRFHYDVERDFWPQELQGLLADNKHLEKKGNDSEFSVRLFGNRSGFPQDSAEVQLSILSSPFGFSDIRFSIQTDARSGVVLEKGLSFLVPSTMEKIAWFGQGPYPSYPGQSLWNRWGLFPFPLTEPVLPGNRGPTDLLIFLDERGYGLGVVLLDGNISLHPGPEGTWVSVNTAVSGLGNGAFPTQYPLREETKTGVFRLLPLLPGRYPVLFKPLVESLR